jgi:hypothetical protein
MQILKKGLRDALRTIFLNLLILNLCISQLYWVRFVFLKVPSVIINSMVGGLSRYPEPPGMSQGRGVAGLLLIKHIISRSPTPILKIGLREVLRIPFLNLFILKSMH